MSKTLGIGWVLTGIPAIVYTAGLELSGGVEGGIRETEREAMLERDLAPYTKI